MSQQEVNDAVQFSIEDIEESLDLLDDDEYIEALRGIVNWCSDRLMMRVAQQRNAGGRG